MVRPAGRNCARGGPRISTGGHYADGTKRYESTRRFWWSVWAQSPKTEVHLSARDASHANLVLYASCKTSDLLTVR
jgi:hypothetical protein